MVDTGRKRRLVLYFDVNNTTVMNDRAQKRGTLETIVRIVTESAWGRAYQVQEGEWKWELAHDQLSQTVPENPNLLANLPEIETEFRICNYEDFIRIKCTNDQGSIDDKKANLRMNFVKPGNPGAKFKSAFEKMVK